MKLEPWGDPLADSLSLDTGARVMVVVICSEARRPRQVARGTFEVEAGAHSQLLSFIIIIIVYHNYRSSSSSSSSGVGPGDRQSGITIATHDIQMQS